MALSVCQPIFGPRQDKDSQVQPMEPSANPQATFAPTSATKQERPKSATKKKCKKNYWQPIITKYADKFDYLPVPPRNFVQDIWKAKRTKNKDKRAHLKIDLKALRRANKKQNPQTIPPRKQNQCMRWLLKPMTERPPEPNPGVPTVTVTDPAGKTWWPKDPNCYITAEEDVAISERMTEQHGGPDYETHRAAFEEALRKGLEHKPLGMRPEVLSCCACWDDQAKFEELFGEEEKVEDIFVY